MTEVSNNEIANNDSSKTDYSLSRIGFLGRFFSSALV
jgi:hypothetical protein